MDLLQTLLLPVGWLVTGAALFYGDRFLDLRLAGSRQKMVGPIPFWWVFVWAAAIGWLFGMVKVDDSPIPLWVQIIVLLLLLLVAVVAFCARFGLRPRH